MRRIELSSNDFRKVGRYYLSGLTCFGIDFAATWTCITIIGFLPYLAHGIGWFLSSGCSFQLNRLWVFKDQRDVLRKFIAFLSLALLAITASTVLLYILHSQIGINFYLAKFLAMGVVSIANYVMASRCIFHESCKYQQL